MNRFKMPTEIYFGQDALGILKELDLGNVLLVCDPFMESSHMVDNITVLLDECSTKYVMFSEVVPDPTIQVVTKGLQAALNIQPQSIIALGGGSALDTAKAIREIYRESTQVKEVKLVCIPTTSGTGSEVTAFSVITDTEEQAKYALVSDEMIPEIAILDPELTKTVPEAITADTGVDVLTHCFEAFVSTNASDFTDACAEKAIKMVWAYLLEATQNGSNLLAREKMHNASCLAGIAFSEASLGVCHSLAHALGGRFHIPHGRANAMILPFVISYNAGLDLPEETATLDRYVLIAELLGIKAGTKKATVRALISKLNRYTDQLGIPKQIEAMGVETSDFLSALSSMSEKALADKCTLTNPRVPTIQDLEGIYKKLSKGGH
ncbi:iron-containing alcohol dehydrogenase [Vagococcus sp. DIV0080]|uniref:Iron-containing alcohol dehydrogenase n=1 Tax=Candidatus Vagococcus giribetii TaxID=2230876 RepID=A0ABS3HU21_9ENTE|nr:1-propanol dehydrogenase PduQ [Vagococcus sp. DIV0080]MBO0477161.1 iron-containing alcohol dehydrogenase [Vagococcus sp. DIV0080]